MDELGGQDEKQQCDSEEEKSDDGRNTAFHGKALRSWTGIEIFFFHYNMGGTIVQDDFFIICRTIRNLTFGKE